MNYMNYEAISPDERLRQNLEVYVYERMEWMGDVVEIFSGGNRNLNPLEELSEPTEVRAEAPDPQLGPEREARLREVAGRFGLGGEVDVISGADYQINEGGKARKVDAEAQINQGAKVIIFAGSPDRPPGDDEIAYMSERLEPGTEVAKTEYDMVRQIAEWQEGFVPLDEPEVLPFGYDIYNQHSLIIQKPAGQLVKIGERNGVPVLHLRVDRENLPEGKFRNRPDGAALMGFISDMLSALGDETSSVGINSSTTYASRAVDDLRASLERGGRAFIGGMYGRHTLARVERKPAAEPTEIQHIPGELHEMQVKLLKLCTAIVAKWPHSNTRAFIS
jgi:hypothetical protein